MTLPIVDALSDAGYTQNWGHGLLFFRNDAPDAPVSLALVG